MARVLLIDDDPEFRASCRAVLETSDLEVTEADGPETGFDTIAANRPDLVILDVLMPEAYEGFALARRIREELDLRQLPILMLTGVHTVKKTPYRFTPDDSHLPVDVFMDKPVPPALLLRTVREMLGLHREEAETPL